MSNFIVEYEQNRRAEAYGLDVVGATMSEGFNTAFEEALVRNPTPSLLRQAERSSHYGASYRYGIDEDHAPAPSKRISAEEANWRYSIPGRLVFEASVAEPVAQSLRDLKLEEIQRQDTLRRSEAGLGTQFTAGLIGSLLDPLNIASAFIPVVGEARFSLLASRMGTGGARAVTGAVEGGVGAAMLEPIVYTVATEEQADYSMADSLMNVVFGTAMGSGLHFGAGYIGDRFAGRSAASSLQVEIDDLPVQAKSDMLRSAEVQVMEGRPVDVSPVADAVLPSRVMARTRDAEVSRLEGESVMEFEARQALIRGVDPQAVDAVTAIRQETEELQYWMGAFKDAAEERTPVVAAAERLQQLQKQLDEPELDWKQMRDISTEMDQLTDQFSRPEMQQAMAEHQARGKKSAKTARQVQKRIDNLQARMPELNRRLSEAFRTAQKALAKSPAGKGIRDRIGQTTERYIDPEDARVSEEVSATVVKEQGAPKEIAAEIADMEAEMAEFGRYVDEADWMDAEVAQAIEEAKIHETAYRRAAGCRMEKSA